MMDGNYYLFEYPNTPLRAEKGEIRELSSGEVLVKIDYTTICGSDLHTFCGVRNEPVPSILGHEVVGTVLDFDQSRTITDAGGAILSVGDRITWTVYASDPGTAVFKQDVPQKNEGLYKYGHRQFSAGDVLNGGLATHIILRPHTCLRILPAELPLPIAATLNCAMATAAGALRLAGSSKGKTVLVSGMGLLGLAIVSMFKEAGAKEILVSDVNPDRLRLAGAFGADVTINTNQHTVQQYLLDEKKNVDLFVDMSGAPDAMEQGIASLGTHGTAVLIGAVFKQRKIAIDAERIFRNLITIRGLHNYNFEDFNLAVDFILKHGNSYPFIKLIEKEFDFTEVNEAFSYAISNKPIRVGIKINRS